MSQKSDTVKWWLKKKKANVNKMAKKIDESWMKEFVGNARMRDDGPKAWESPPQMGMDKIRATTNAGKYFVDFASTSSVHGINHLTAPHRHSVERFLTVVFIGGALATAILLSLYFWDRYQNDATILVIDNKYRNIEFTVTTPSLLACPLEKIDERLFADVFKKHKINDTTEARQFFAFIANATYLELENTPIYTEVPSDMWLTILWELKSKVRATLIGHELNDDSATRWIITEEGFCLMFFSYSSIYMSYDYWMENNWTIVEPPPVLPSLTYFKREAIRGFTSEEHAVKVSVEDPLDVPEIGSFSIILLRSQLCDLYFDPKQISTSDDVKSLATSQRRCKIPEDDGLLMWPVYSYRMCLLECRYEIIRKLCGCYPHFARPISGIKVCTAEQLRCVGQKTNNFMKISHDKEIECGCLPNCDTSGYVPTESKVTTAKEGSPNFTVVKTHLNFPHDKVRRELLFGFNDFLAAVGGAGGLFLGASVLSFTEILYFITVHLFWYRVQLRRDKKIEIERKRKVEKFFIKNAYNIEKQLKY